MKSSYKSNSPSKKPLLFGQPPSRLLGHRGARGEAPENTLAGFAYLQSLNTQGLPVAGIELDVQLTQDNKLAVHHDDTLLRTCGLPARVDELSSQRLAAIPQNKLAQLFFGKYPPQPISLLADVVPYLTCYQHIELEIKTHIRTDHKRLVKALVGELGQSSYAQLPITLTSFDTKLLEVLKDVDLPFRRGLLIENIELAQNPYELLNLAKRLQVHQVGIFQACITQKLVDLLHLHHLKVTAWTVNDITRASQLSTWGVNHIITDYPKHFLTQTHNQPA